MCKLHEIIFGKGLLTEQKLNLDIIGLDNLKIWSSNYVNNDLSKADRKNSAIRRCFYLTFFRGTERQLLQRLPSYPLSRWPISLPEDEHGLHRFQT